MPHWLQPMEPCTLDLPAAHGVQIVAFAAEKKPAIQYGHMVMSSVSLARKRPAAHPIQKLAPLRRYVPAAHCVTAGAGPGVGPQDAGVGECVGGGVGGVGGVGGSVVGATHSWFTRVCTPVQAEHLFVSCTGHWLPIAPWPLTQLHTLVAHRRLLVAVGAADSY
jgi:hypothetical protein